MSNSYLDELNGAQREAVEYIDGPALVIAGAGSGKTRVLTYKIMHLLDNGYKPWNILAITFTNKAAKEMKERIAAKIGQEQASKLYMGTFHSIFMRILRQEAKFIPPYNNNFTIYDQTDAKSVVKGILKDMKLDEKSYPSNDVCSRISNAKNHLITADRYGASPMCAEDISMRRPLIEKIYHTYSQRCKSANAMDFDDLLLQMHFLLANNPQIVEKYSQKFKYILVDEYQDTNAVQYNIVKSLGSLHHKVFVVGDDAQSIYSFRGAQIENILNFRKDYKEAKLFKLEQNYRSTQTIVNAANAVIAQNSKQIPKDTFSENEEGGKIKVMEAAADNDEGYQIAAEISKETNRGDAEYKDFALLYRTNAQSRILEEALRKRAIPYRIYGGMSFYQRKEIKDLIAYFRLLVNGNDDEAFKRIVNYPKRGIGETTVDKIAAVANENNLSIWNTVARIKELDSSISPRTINAIASFMKMIYQLKLVCENSDAHQAAMQIASTTGILKELNADKTPEGTSRYENVQELLNGIKNQVETRLKETGNTLTLAEYLEEVSLMTGDEKEDENPNQVTLMTIHSAKGLEFKNVYITGVEEGLFPSSRSIDSQRELEEERRLFYVAVTRAEKKLTLSFSHMRYKWGQLTPATPSRFIKEIENTGYLDFGSGGQSLFELSDQPFTQKRHPNSLAKMADAKIKKYNFSNPAGGFRICKSSEVSVGSIIEHEKFGKGKIVNIEGSNLQHKAIIDFMSVGRKLLILEFAKIKIIQ